MKKIIRQYLNRQNLEIVHKYDFGFVNFPRLCWKLIQSYGSISFIQIGGNDGMHQDPIYDFIQNNSSKVHGHILEPIKYYYDLCIETYKKQPSINVHEIAIANFNGDIDFYFVDPKRIKELHPDARGIGSVYKDHWKKSGLIPDESYIVSSKVPCLKFSALCEKFDIDNLDLLIIDAEGYDYTILKDIHSQQIQPKLIRFEHSLRVDSDARAQLNNVKKLFETSGYSLIVDHNDSYLIREDFMLFTGFFDDNTNS